MSFLWFVVLSILRQMICFKTQTCWILFFCVLHIDNISETTLLLHFRSSPAAPLVEISPLWCHTVHWSPLVSNHTSMPTVGSALCGRFVFPNVRGPMFGVQLLLGSPGWQNEDELLQKRRRGSRWVIGHPGDSWQRGKAGKLICFLNTVYTNWLDFFEADVCPGLELRVWFCFRHTNVQSF